MNSLPQLMAISPDCSSHFVLISFKSLVYPNWYLKLFWVAPLLTWGRWEQRGPALTPTHGLQLVCPHCAISLDVLQELGEVFTNPHRWKKKISEEDHHAHIITGTVMSTLVEFIALEKKQRRKSSWWWKTGLHPWSKLESTLNCHFISLGQSHNFQDW